MRHHRFKGHLFGRSVYLFTFLSYNIGYFSNTLHRPGHLSCTRTLRVFRGNDSRTDLNYLATKHIFPTSLTSGQVGGRHRDGSNRKSRPSPPLVSRGPGTSRSNISGPTHRVFRGNGKLLLRVTGYNHRHHDSVPRPIFVRVTREHPFRTFTSLRTLFQPRHRTTGDSNVNEGVSGRSPPYGKGSRSTGQSPSHTFERGVTKGLLRSSHRRH